MQSNAAKIGLLAALAAVAVVLFIVLSGGDSDEDPSTSDPAGEQTTATAPAEPAVETIEMRDGVPVGGVRRLTYAKGDPVRIAVELDDAQEDIHIHGYDEEVLNPQAGTVVFAFPATIEGIFELEAHGPSGEVVLAEIVVNPG